MYARDTLKAAKKINEKIQLMDKNMFDVFCSFYKEEDARVKIIKSCEIVRENTFPHTSNDCMIEKAWGNYKVYVNAMLDVCINNEIANLTKFLDKRIPTAEIKKIESLFYLYFFYQNFFYKSFPVVFVSQDEELLCDKFEEEFLAYQTMRSNSTNLMKVARDNVHEITSSEKNHHLILDSLLSKTSFEISNYLFFCFLFSELRAVHISISQEFIDVLKKYANENAAQFYLREIFLLGVTYYQRGEMLASELIHFAIQQGCILDFDFAPKTIIEIELEQIITAIKKAIQDDDILKLKTHHQLLLEKFNLDLLSARKIVKNGIDYLAYALKHHTSTFASKKTMSIATLSFLYSQKALRLFLEVDLASLQIKEIIKSDAAEKYIALVVLLLLCTEIDKEAFDLLVKHKHQLGAAIWKFTKDMLFDKAAYQNIEYLPFDEKIVALNKQLAFLQYYILADGSITKRVLEFRQNLTQSKTFLSIKKLEKDIKDEIAMLALQPEFISKVHYTKIEKTEKEKSRFQLWFSWYQPWNETHEEDVVNPSLRYSRNDQM